MSPTDYTGLVGMVVSILPEVISMIKTRHSGGESLTDAQVLSALEQAVASGIAEDDQWLAAHPKIPTSSDENG